ncbi:MAG TPA: hypothetical protein VHV08_02680 [Pirellulales bacterium]|jgi:hypothetical protein|nr:hypothetical protein [Pirellulales bacterium]
MTNPADARNLFEALRPGDRVEVVHDVKIGSTKSWTTATTGTVVHTERRRQGLHFRRSIDDKVFADMIILKRPDGEETTITMDEFTQLRRLN